MLSSVHLLILITMLVACKSDGSEPDSMVTEIPSEFVDFYRTFHADSVFQMNHIVFPLQSREDSLAWTKDEWIMHQPFNDMDGEYIRDFKNIGGIIIEHVVQKNGLVHIERRFARSRASYNLIYYKITSSF